MLLTIGLSRKSTISAKILGNIPSKSNSYKIKSVRGRAKMYKSKELINYEKSFLVQLPLAYRNMKIDGYFSIAIDVYFPSNRSDLDNSLKIFLDCLEKVTETIKNDNKCVQIFARKGIDKNNPRIEFTLEVL